MTYHIWLLNATESLLTSPSLRGRVERLLGFPVQWETRTIGDRVLLNLMPDEEYFVPIAIKCLGSLWNDSSMTPEGRDIVSRMRKLYFDEWKLPPPESFWDQSSSFRSMHTPSLMGYYELIRYRHHPGDKHILIGYSQGGVVARFLAFMDEYLYRDTLIDSVITIASPLKGSPLADPLRREDITDAMIAISLALFSFYQTYDHRPGFSRLMSLLSRNIDFETIDNLLSAWIEDALPLADVSPYYASLASYLFTFRKWLSGLKGNKESAFWELSPRRLFSPFSVLSLIQKPLRAKTASIVTSNHQVEEMARDYMALTQGRWIRWAWRILRGWILSRQIGGQTLHANLTTIQRLYDQEIMGRECGEHHDFMVPSSSQFIEDTPTLGRFLAPRASHLSGKDPTSPGGREIIRHLLTALTRYRLWQQ